MLIEIVRKIRNRFGILSQKKQEKYEKTAKVTRALLGFKLGSLNQTFLSLIQNFFKLESQIFWLQNSNLIKFDSILKLEKFNFLQKTVNKNN